MSLWLCVLGVDGLEVGSEIRGTSVGLSLSLAGLLAHCSKKPHLIRADTDWGWGRVGAGAVLWLPALWPILSQPWHWGKHTHTPKHWLIHKETDFFYGCRLYTLSHFSNILLLQTVLSMFSSINTLLHTDTVLYSHLELPTTVFCNY